LKGNKAKNIIKTREQKNGLSGIVVKSLAIDRKRENSKD